MVNENSYSRLQLACGRVVVVKVNLVYQLAMQSLLGVLNLWLNEGTLLAEVTKKTRLFQFCFCRGNNLVFAYMGLTWLV